MRRFLRLLTLWLIALALPLQGATAAMAMTLPAAHAAMASTAAANAMSAMLATHDAAPCPHHPAAAKAATSGSGCGACCGPAATPRSTPVIAPAAEAWMPAMRGASSAAAPAFLTDGPDRPPRPLLA